MGKKKRSRAAAPFDAKASLGRDDSANDDDDDEWGGLDVADVATTIRVATTLARRPDLLASKPFKPLRAALFPLVQLQLKKYDPVDYVARVTAALQQGKAQDALLALEGMREFGLSAKQGTIQRWVRECDAISSEGGLRVRLLQAVLQASRPPSVEQRAGGGEGGGEPGGAGGGGEGEQQIIEHPAWRADEGQPPRGAGEEGQPPQGAEDEGGATRGAGGGGMRPLPALTLRVVMKEAAAERQPPNHYDLNIFACKPGEISLASGQEAAARVRRVDCPHVPGAFVLLDVLSTDECDLLIAAAHQMGFTPDHPLSRPSPSGIEACEWLVDEHVIDPIFERCRQHLPQQVAGGEVAGINPRWRMFRYTDTEGAVYRPHIDGSWPGSGLDAEGKYRHDLRGDHRSRYTFLVYLTGGFEGGATTFYIPDEAGLGLHARRVQPVRGAVLCFPQGNTASLLHEGSAVIRGEKVVIRSDVLYKFPRRG